MNRGRAPLPPSVEAPLCRYVDLDARLAPGGDQCLSADERERAVRLHFDSDRARFVAAHVALRHVLAEGSTLHAAQIGLACGRFGKPWMPERPRLRFSLSHSRALALIVVGQRGPLGVDVELMRPMPDAMALAARHFTPNENAALRALPAHDRERAFLVCWTRKEACLKAIGLGLRVPPETLEVGLQPRLRQVRLSLGGRTLLLDVGPAPARPDSVASIAEWIAPVALFGMPGALAQMLAAQTPRHCFAAPHDMAHRSEETS